MEKQSQESTLATQLSTVEADLSKTYADRMAKAVAAAEARGDSKYQRLEEEYAALERRLSEMTACTRHCIVCSHCSHGTLSLAGGPRGPDAQPGRDAVPAGRCGAEGGW
jgi:hypothetical protein